MYEKTCLPIVQHHLHLSALSVSSLSFNEGYISHSLNTEAHKIQTLTAVQIPLLHN